MSGLAERALMAAFYTGLVLGIAWAVTVLGAVVLSLLSVWRFTFSGAPIGFLLMHVEHSIVIAAGIAGVLYVNQRRRKRLLRVR